MNNVTTNTVTFPDTRNGNALRAAVLLTLADQDFMDDTKKINKAVDILTPKDDLTRVFKMLQGNALKDYLLEKEKGNVSDSPKAKAEHIKEYVSTRFKKHMTNPATGTKATNMFHEAYPEKVEEKMPELEATGEFTDAGDNAGSGDYANEENPI